jgi:short-subunit dehydrogenase
MADATSDLEVGLLVYNVGANTAEEFFLDGELADFRRVIDLNMGAPLALVHQVGRSMRDRGRGGIMLVGSMAGHVGSQRQAAYAGAKAFGRIFAESLWAELRDYGRATANHSQLCRAESGWQIVACISRLLDGNGAAGRLLSASVAGEV